MLTDIPTRTQRRPPAVAPDEQALRAALRQIAADRPRWGYRRAHAPVRARKRRCPADQPDRSALRAPHPDEVWPMDFQHDMTADGGRCAWSTSSTSSPARR